MIAEFSELSLRIKAKQTDLIQLGPCDSRRYKGSSESPKCDVAFSQV